jgi:hypothetical protein
MAMLPRDATDAYLQRQGRELDITFDIDLGELVRGHHVIARGLELGRPVMLPRWMVKRREELHRKLRERMAAQNRVDPSASGIHLETHVLGSFPAEDMEMVDAGHAEPVLHHEFVPGLTRGEEIADRFFWYWMLHVADDAETIYRADNTGARGPAEGGDATHATRDLGGQIPEEAKGLILTFEPPGRWTPPKPWRRELVIDLVAKTVVE